MTDRVRKVLRPLVVALLLLGACASPPSPEPQPEPVEVEKRMKPERIQIREPSQ